MSTECFNAVLKLMIESNRPHNVQTIINNTASKYTKTQIEKVLHQLVQDNKIVYEEVGKSGKLYYYNQSLCKCLSDEEIAKLNKEIEELEEKNKELSANLQEKKKQMQFYNSLMSEDELKQQVDKYKSKLDDVTKKLEIYKNKPVISGAQMNKLIDKIKKNMKIWSQRNGYVDDVLGNLAESMEKKVSTIKNDMGLDAPEHKLSDIKAKLNELIQ